MPVNNTLYIAQDRLQLHGVDRALAGAGVFAHQSATRTLTAQTQMRSLWELPRWFYPARGKPSLSYHSEQGRWKRIASGVLLQTVGRGQEFVLDCDHYPEALAWLRDIFADVS
jgi:hypothetical protein